jgi:immunoglobulin heavy chain
MAWDVTNIHSAFLFTGVHSEVQLQQSGPKVVNAGASVKLSCKSSGYSFSRYKMECVKQSHVKSLEWIEHINLFNGITNYNGNFKSKATLTVDISSSTAYMELSRLTSEDSEVYYCARYCCNHLLSVSETLEEEEPAALGRRRLREYSLEDLLRCNQLGIPFLCLLILRTIVPFQLCRSRYMNYKLLI